MPHAVEKIVMAEESERVESYSSITKNIFPLTQGYSRQLGNVVTYCEIIPSIKYKSALIKWSC